LNQFVLEAVRHGDYIRVKMLKRRAVIQDSVPPRTTPRARVRERGVATDVDRIASPPARVTAVEKTMTPTQDCPVALYEEV
jgi:hypothetical protein